MTNLEIQTISISIRNISNLLIQWKQGFNQLLKISWSNANNIESNVTSIYMDVKNLFYSESMKAYLDSFTKLLTYSYTNNNLKIKNIKYYNTIEENKKLEKLEDSNALTDIIDNIIIQYKALDLSDVINAQLYLETSNRQYHIVSNILNLHNYMFTELSYIKHLVGIIYILNEGINNEDLQIPTYNFNVEIYNNYKHIIVELMKEYNYILDNQNCFIKCGICNAEPNMSKKNVDLKNFSIIDTTKNNDNEVDNVTNDTDSVKIYKSSKIWIKFNYDTGPCKNPTLNVNNTGDMPLYIKYNNTIEVGSILRYIPAGIYPCYFQNAKYIITNVTKILP